MLAESDMSSSSTTSPPFPPPGQFVEAVRTSAARAVEQANIKVTDESMRAFLSSLNRDDYLKLSEDHGASGLPLAFETPLQELNLLSVLALLNFGSSFRQPLHAFHQRGVYDTIRFFVLSCHISSTNSEEILSAKTMSTISDTRVAELLGGLPLMEEKEHETLPGIRVGTKGGRLAELVMMIQAVMNTTGRILNQKGYRDLGSLVVELFEQAREVHLNDDKAFAAFVVEGLVRAIPAFQDMYLVDGEREFLSLPFSLLVLLFCPPFLIFLALDGLPKQLCISSRRRSSSSTPSANVIRPSPTRLSPARKRRPSCPYSRTTSFPLSSSPSPS